MALARKSAARGQAVGKWLSGLLGAREIENRVDESFPTWDEYAERKSAEELAAQQEEPRLDLPPHRVYISSPLHGSFLYFTLVLVGLALGIFSPELAPVLVYAAIAVALLVSLFVVFRDAVFFHIEALRLEADADMINRHNRGPRDDDDERGIGFLRSISRKNRNRKIFRSRLLQIHYQNVLRTFEQGNRRAWVDQDASIGELHTLLSQRGMKLVWTMIEVLPQLGLLGTLIGLMRMFLAFRADTAAPEVAILAGFATALGTTVVANLFVLILRPLYMRNERCMYEMLSTIQTLMAMFILPTQQTVLDRTLMLGSARAVSQLAGQPLPGPGAGPGAAPTVTPGQESRLFNSLGELTHALSEFTETQQKMDSGAMAKETAEIAQEVKDTLRAFTESVDRTQLERQQHAIEELGEAVRGLASNLSRVERPAADNGPAANGPAAERIEHDLTQLRVLTHDTLLLLEQIAGRLDPIPARRGRMLSNDAAVRGQVFGGTDSASGASGAAGRTTGAAGSPAGAAGRTKPDGLMSLEDDAEAAADGEEAANARVRLFKERG